jgi:hypothetical protein
MDPLILAESEAFLHKEFKHSRIDAMIEALIDGMASFRSSTVISF